MSHFIFSIKKTSFFAFTALFSVSALAAEVCDPQFMETLKHKAAIETMREIQINNTIIKKPDSVLAYSCFDRDVQHIGSNIIPMFSEKPEALNPVLSGIGSFYMSSFMDAPVAGTAPSFSSSTGTFSGCDTMSAVWSAVKCTLVDRSSNQASLAFSDLLNMATAGNDPRSTANYSCNGAAASIKTVYTDGIKRATDLVGTRTTVNGQINLPTYDYFSVASVNYCLTDPKDGKALDDGNVCIVSGSGKKCKDMAAIPTGIIVTYDTEVGEKPPGTPFWNYVCVNPGCYYNPSANAASTGYSESTPVPPSGIMCSQKPF